MVRALLAGIGIAIMAGPIGCFIVWRRMAYFGDTMAHSSLLGVALGIVMGANLTISVIFTAMLVALLLVALNSLKKFATDTLMGILSHATLAIGLVSISLMTWLRVDLIGYLFGDILSVTQFDIIIIYVGVIVVNLTMGLLWRPLLAITVSEEIANAEGIAVWRIRLVFMLLIAFVIALSMKIVGILLITALLIIPAAVARRFSSSPGQMAFMAIFFGILSVSIGLASSLQWDSPTGPSIVLTAFILFCSHIGNAAKTSQRPKNWPHQIATLTGCKITNKAAAMIVTRQKTTKRRATKRRVKFVDKHRLNAWLRSRSFPRPHCQIGPTSKLCHQN